MKDAFTLIYRDNLWNGVESRSGPGSGSAATTNVAPAIVELVESLGIRTVLDVGCGDGYWMPDLPGYVGIDVAPEAIRRARRHHPRREYLVGTLDRLQLHAFDLVISRDAMQHLSFRDGIDTLSRILATGSRWLLASTYVDGENVDIETGDCYSPDLSAAPFYLDDPVRLIFDGYTYHDPDAVRDPRKHLGLWRLTTT